MKKIGAVTHYYGNIGVAIIALTSKLSKGDKIKFEGGKTEFEQVVESMQVEHKEIDSAKKGDIIGIKVSEKVAEGVEVSLVE
ncbi:MAG: translation elongation factor-like protein [bacterium]|nr:translation elongation factor-like protein [bacterium]